MTQKIIQTIIQQLRKGIPSITVNGTGDFTSVETGELSYAEGRNSEEDGNSPWSGAGAQSHTFTLAGTYDLVYIEFEQITNTSGVGQAIELVVDEDTTAQYDQLSTDGSSISNAAAWELLSDIPDGRPWRGHISIGGAAPSGEDVTVQANAGFGGSAGLSVGLFDQNIGDLDSITVKGATGSISVDARVIGVTL